jgi:transposase InsO family protein
MAYSNNPYLGKARVEAVRLVKVNGWSQSKVARHTGVNQSAISKWCKRAPLDLRYNIPTLSSKPRSSPKALNREIVQEIIRIRRRYNRCAPVVHKYLEQEGIIVSLSSVRRTLSRHSLTKPRSKWARYRPHVHRPIADSPGALVQIDTIHYIDPTTNTRYYFYTLIDLYTRMTYAKYSLRINPKLSYAFILEAQKSLGFKFQTIQADNGQEFSNWLNDSLKANGITLRHSRVRKCNDNAHIERFNRTIQDECIGGWPSREKLDQNIAKYIAFYNQDRLHLGIGLTTPQNMYLNYSKVLN